MPANSNSWKEPIQMELNLGHVNNYEHDPDDYDPIMSQVQESLQPTALGLIG